MTIEDTSKAYLPASIENIVRDSNSLSRTIALYADELSGDL